MMQSFSRLRILALLLPALLLAGAYISELVFGLYPCEMCWWQRWPHFAALVPAALAFVVKNDGTQRVLVSLAAFAIFTSGLIGVYHAGVEYGWWEGVTSCANGLAADGDVLDSILNAPLIRCDVAPWTLFGISLAGYNFLLSCGGAIAILAGIWRNAKN